MAGVNKLHYGVGENGELKSKSDVSESFENSWRHETLSSFVFLIII